MIFHSNIYFLVIFATCLKAPKIIFVGDSHSDKSSIMGYFGGIWRKVIQ